MTTRELLNKVLRGLRQETIASGTASLTETYHLLILQLLNEAKEEVEECWDWYALRQTVTVTLSAGTADYDISGTNDRTRLLYEKANGYNDTCETSGRGYGTSPQVFDVTDSTESRLTETTPEKIERMHLTDSDDTGNPEYFALYADSDSIKMKVWPTPSATRTLKVRFAIPQDELASDSLDTVLSIPSRPVWTLALYKANEERGSELGRPGSSLYMAYVDALHAAMDREMTDADRTSYPE